MNIINDINRIDTLEKFFLDNTKDLKEELSKQPEQRSASAIRIALLNLIMIQREFKKTLDTISKYDFVNDFSK